MKMRKNSDTAEEDPNGRRGENIKYQGQIALISARGFDGERERREGEEAEGGG